MENTFYYKKRETGNQIQTGLNNKRYFLAQVSEKSVLQNGFQRRYNQGSSSRSLCFSPLNSPLCFSFVFCLASPVLIMAARAYGATCSLDLYLGQVQCGRKFRCVFKSIVSSQ